MSVKFHGRIENHTRNGTGAPPRNVTEIKMLEYAFWSAEPLETKEPRMQRQKNAKREENIDPEGPQTRSKAGKNSVDLRETTQKYRAARRPAWNAVFLTKTEIPERDETKLL